MVQAVKLMASERADSTGDMFGFDDSAMREAEQMARVATAKQRDISQRLAAITGAAKNPALAKAEGVNVRDPGAVLARAEQLLLERAAWDNWPTNPELVALIRGELGIDAPPPRLPEPVQDLPLDNPLMAEPPPDAPNPARALDYQIEHKPMTVDGGAATLDDLEPAFGPDIYGKDALQFVGSGDTREASVLRVLKRVRGKPDALVTIYRGVPDGVTKINPGDWVTLDKAVAADYGAVISMKVPAKHVTGWADSLLEFGYHPPQAEGQGARLVTEAPELAGAAKADPIAKLNEPADAPVKPLAAPLPDAVAARVANLEATSPDMVVRIADDGRPVTLAEDLAEVRRIAAEGTDDMLGTLDADLLQVAVNCALSGG